MRQKITALANRVRKFRPKMTRSRVIKIFIILLVLLTILFFFYRARTAAETKNRRESYKIARGDLRQTMTISGSIDAEEHMVLRFQFGGKLVWVGVKEGDYIKKWAAVASLDRRELQKKLDRILKDYMITRWDFDQTKDDNKVIVNDKIKRIVDKSQFSLDKSVIDVEIANLALEEASISTPIEGIVVRVTSPYAGVNVAPNQAEFEIVNPKTIYFKASADQTEVSKLQNGKDGELILDPFTDEKITGKIKDISFIPQSGDTGAVYPVKFVFESVNNDYKYKIGMTGDLSFVTDERQNVLYVPIKFVKSENGKHYVNLKKADKMVKKNVETGLETDNLIEIKSGLSKGEVVYD